MLFCLGNTVLYVCMAVFYMKNNIFITAPVSVGFMDISASLESGLRYSFITVVQVAIKQQRQSCGGWRK